MPDESNLSKFMKLVIEHPQEPKKTELKKKPKTPTPKKLKKNSSHPV